MFGLTKISDLRKLMSAPLDDNMHVAINHLRDYTLSESKGEKIKQSSANNKWENRRRSRDNRNTLTHPCTSMFFKQRRRSLGEWNK